MNYKDNFRTRNTLSQNKLNFKCSLSLQVMSLLVVALAWGCMWLPLHLFLFQTVLRRVTGWDGWHLPPGFEIAIVVTGYSNAAVTPLLWLCHRPIRSSVADFLCCRQCLCNEEQMDKSDKRSKGTVITIV